jgi:hypothetical protein
LIDVSLLLNFCWFDMKTQMRVLFTITIFIGSMHGFAQDPQLFENTWYLEKLVINGDDVFHPINSEIQFVSLIVSASFLDTEVCNGYGGGVLDVNNDTITVDVLFQLPQNCFLPSTNQFETIYLEDFWIWSQQGNIFDYEIQMGANDIKVLILTNENDNLAIYNNQLLSLNDNLNSQIVIYPNPAEEKIFITGINGPIGYSLYNIQGNTVKEGLINRDEPILVSNFQSGLYLLKLEDGRTGKIIIE